MISGELVGALAMTEPSTGSDVQAIKTKAIRDGNTYRLSGQKTFITNGQHANLIIVAAKTDPSQRAKGVSLMVLETDGAAGFKRGRNLDKIGMKASDTSELFFDNVDIPPENLLGGEEGRGFYQLMSQLPQERLIIACGAIGAMEGAVARTIQYCQEREAFGGPLTQFQNTRFKLAECLTRTKVARAFLDECIAEHLRGELISRKSGHGEILDHRHAERGARRLPATAWRLWLHAGICGRRNVDRRPRPAHLWRHQRDHEGTDRAQLHRPEIRVNTSSPRALRDQKDEYLQQDEARGPPRPALPPGYRTIGTGLHLARPSALQPVTQIPF